MANRGDSEEKCRTRPFNLTFLPDEFEKCFDSPCGYFVSLALFSFTFLLK